MCMFAVIILFEFVFYAYFTEGADCEDSYNTEDCQYWASYGECEANPPWMTSNCQRSCNTCGQSTVKNSF